MLSTVNVIFYSFLSPSGSSFFYFPFHCSFCWMTHQNLVGPTSVFNCLVANPFFFCLPFVLFYHKKACENTFFFSENLWTHIVTYLCALYEEPSRSTTHVVFVDESLSISYASLLRKSRDLNAPCGVKIYLKMKLPFLWVPNRYYTDNYNLVAVILVLSNNST